MNKKQVQNIAARLKELGIIERFDIEKLNGHLMDTVRSDMSRKDAPGTQMQAKPIPNLFADKERFFSDSIKKAMENTKPRDKGNPITAKKPTAPDGSELDLA